MHVLDTSGVLASVEEEQDSEQGSDAGSKKLHIRGLRQTEQIEEISATQQTKLVEEASLNASSLVGSAHVEWSAIGVLFIGIVDEFRIFVVGHELCDLRLVLSFELVLIKSLARG